MNTTHAWRWMTAMAVALAGCSDVLSLDVEAPGRIADSDLNTPEAVQGLVVGMSFNLTQAIDEAIPEILMAGGETGHGGANDFGTYLQGDLHSAPEDWDGEYGRMQQARWVAEHGIQRMTNVLPSATFEKSAQVAQAYLFAGLTNRLLGEVQCESTIDGGPKVSYAEHFMRADSFFTRAIAVGTAAGSAGAALVTAGYAGRASVRAWLGRWDEAEADAARVPAAFQFNALFSTSPGAVPNGFVERTWSRKEISIYGSVWEAYSNDPRVPWAIKYDKAGQVEKGQDGATPFYQQFKYTSQDDDIALVKGTEMLLLRAEARLLKGDLQGMTDRLNEARAFYKMPGLGRPGTAAEAWPILRFERGATLWLEGRRLNDLRRWKAAGPPQADPWAASRDVCFPISWEEQRVNPNIHR